MKLNDESVLDPLHLEAADLSTGRSFVQELDRNSPKPNAPDSTRAILEFRGILSGEPRVTSWGGLEQEAEAPPSHPHGLNRSVQEDASRAPVVWIPVAPLDRDRFDVLQKFEGTVVSLTGDSFVARLEDKTNPGPEEEAEIPLAEVMPGDRELVKPGAVFYWVIGYRRTVHGQLSRSSVIRFQRMPPWSSADAERSTEAAKTFLSFLDLERANNSA